MFHASCSSVVSSCFHSFICRAAAASNCALSAAALAVGIGSFAASAEDKPFADFPRETRDYLQRIQGGKQDHAYKSGQPVAAWRAGCTNPCAAPDVVEEPS